VDCALKLEEEAKARIKDYDLKTGDLVLVKNLAIKMSIN
jgi:hypothetical protein